MGRQAYLSKIAFGRSAFAPTEEATESEHYVQLESSHSELPERYQSFNGNNYVQLYDERGNPMNPRSHEYGKKLRNAQNDVLAAVGVVERRKSPADGLPGSNAAQLEELDEEDSAGNLLAMTVLFNEQFCLWWTGVIKDRILTFRYDDALHFAHIAFGEYASSGRSIFYAGAVPSVLGAVCTYAVVYTASVFRPLERLVLATNASSRFRKALRRSRGLWPHSIRVAAQLLFYPLEYHADLQRTGLLPAWPLLPTWRAFIPFSRASPLLPVSIYYDPTASAIDCFKATFTSPFVMFCIGQAFGHWIHATINEAVESSVIRPNNPDIVGRDVDGRYRTSTILGARRESPRSVRKVINRVLTALGWGMPCTDDTPTQEETSDSPQQVHATEQNRAEIGVVTVENITPLDIPVSQAPADGGIQAPIVDDVPLALEVSAGIARPTTPPTPTIFEFQDGDDPRIRITSRDDVVEMEVRLPPRILSSHTELAEALAVSQSIGPRQPLPSMPDRAPNHRVTQLSVEPSRMIESLVRTQIIRLAILPLRMVALRLTASHFLASRGSSSSPNRLVNPVFSFSDVTWSTVGVQLSRVALCSALQLAINFSLWEMQYITVVQVGKNLFGWGTL